MTLWERETHLDELRAALVRAARGRGTTLLVSGEAGIGKTSLLDEFAATAGPRARVLRGGCEDLLTPRPLGPFRDIARCLRDRPAPGGDEREALLEALLTEMAIRTPPAVVIVDDAHWADDASLDLVRYLARRIRELPAVLVVAYRDEELTADHPLHRVVGAIAGPSTRHLRLSGLSDALVAGLAAAAGRDPAAVVAAVAGNPFFLTELLAAPDDGVPVSVRHAVLARVAALPPSCGVALQQLAVLTGEVPAELVARLLDDPAVLEPAERRGMLLRGPRGVRFRHELARRAIEESLPAARAVELHRRALDVLLAGGAEASRLVHHAVAVADERAVARHAAAAALEAAAASSHREAAAFAELALRHRGRARVLDVAAMHGVAAHALHALNRFGAAAAHADRAVQLWDTVGTTPLRLGDALLISARMSTLLADPVAARQKALRALDVLEPLGPSRALALAFSTLAAQDAVQSRFADAVAHAGRALALARETGALDVVAHALCYRGVARATGGDDGGLADLRESVRLAARLGQADHLTVAAHNLAVVLLRSGRLRDAEPWLDLAARWAREHRLDVAAFRIESQQCHLLLLRGRWDEAQTRLQALLAGGADAGAAAVNPMAFLGRILARRADPGAVELIEAAWALAAATAEEQKMAIAAAARVEQRWLAGDTAATTTLGAAALEITARAAHHYLRGEVARRLRHAGAVVTSFPGCPPGFAAGIAGDRAAAAALWEQAGNPYEQALELAEGPDPAAIERARAMLTALGATATLTRLGLRPAAAGPEHISGRRE